jgi:predicted transcriptional regulator
MFLDDMCQNNGSDYVDAYKRIREMYGKDSGIRVITTIILKEGERLASDWEYITRDVCYFLGKEKTKISKKALDWLDYDYVSIVKYHDVFWYERDTQYMPKYIREYLNKFIKKNLAVEYVWNKITERGEL